MSLPYSSSNPAVSNEKNAECLAAGKAIRILLEKDIRPSDIMTREAFENAIVIIMVLGGSTNAVLHLIAMAKSVGVSLTQDDFQAVSNRIPVLAATQPLPNGYRQNSSRKPGRCTLAGVRNAESNFPG
jgi:dihydroxy-acid dehydratase